MLKTSHDKYSNAIFVQAEVFMGRRIGFLSRLFDAVFLVGACLLVALAVNISVSLPSFAQKDEAATLNQKVVEFYRAEAIPFAQRSLAIREKALGPDHPEVAQSLNNLALLYEAQGRYADAEPLYKRALAIKEKSLGPNHPNVATSLNNLAWLYQAQGRYADAEPLYKRALAIYEKALGPDHPYVADPLNNLALLYQAQGRYADAEPFNKRALAIYEKALGPDGKHCET